MSRTNSAGALFLVKTKRRTSGFRRFGRAASISAVRSAPLTATSRPPFLSRASAAEKNSRNVSGVPKSARRRRSDGGTRPEPSTRHGGFAITASNIGSVSVFAAFSPALSCSTSLSRMSRRSSRLATSPHNGVKEPSNPSAAALHSAASASTASRSSPTARHSGFFKSTASDTTPQPAPSSASTAPSGRACSVANRARRSASALKRNAPSGCSRPTGKAARAACTA